jgi:hypothetical protein
MIINVDFMSIYIKILKMDDARELLRRMRKALNEDSNEFQQNDDEVVVDKDIKDMSMRDMLKLTRNNSSNEKKTLKRNIEKKISPSEEKREQEKFEDFFRNNNVIVDFQPLKVFPYGVFWGGTIDGQIQWVYKVTPYEETSGIDVNILKGFQKDDPENEEIIEKLEKYYDTFYKFWRDNELDNEITM